MRTGYTERVAREVRERLDPLIVRCSPLSVPVKKPKATRVRPEVHAEVEYCAITDDGLLRAAVFKGLRDDLARASAKAAATFWRSSRCRAYHQQPCNECARHFTVEPPLDAPE